MCQIKSIVHSLKNCNTNWFFLYFRQCLFVGNIDEKGSLTECLFQENYWLKMVN